jgi:hypothetical protein
MTKKAGSDKQFEQGRSSWEEGRRDRKEFDRWWMDEKVQKTENAPARESLWEMILDIFPDDREIDRAAMHVPLDPRDAQLLKRVRANLADTGRLNIAKLAHHDGLSRRTVKKRITTLLSIFLKKGRQPTAKAGLIEAVKIKGERSPRYYLRHEFAFGEWRSVVKERIRKPPLPVPVGHATHCRQSPMNRLFDALIVEFANLPKTSPRPAPEFASDWDFNCRRGETLLKKAPRPLNAQTVYYALGKHSKPCKSCRAPILPGFRLAGRTVTRAKEFCDDACRVKYQRESLKRNQVSSFRTV